jgi:hypothetical protein
MGWAGAPLGGAAQAANRAVTIKINSGERFTARSSQDAWGHQANSQRVGLQANG